MSNQRSIFDEIKPPKRSRDEILTAIRTLCDYHRQGKLGGEIMPEDANPHLDRTSRENCLYFTLPMALNYQRNSYNLWKSALATYNDPEVSFVFTPELVAAASEDDVRRALLKHKVALQPSKHTAIWLSISNTLLKYYNGDVRNLFSINDNDIAKILNDVQVERKKGFPYLSGQKIANYWLYVILQYTDLQLSNRQHLSIAPDTHVIQSSIILGAVEDTGDHNALRPRVAAAWQDILKDTDLSPIDIHTPLWLWSRRKFSPAI